MKQLYLDYLFLLNLSLKEDLSLTKNSIVLNKDITTNSFPQKNKNVTAIFVAKEKMVVCGIVFLKYLAKNILKDFQCKFFVKEGEVVSKGQKIANWRGAIDKILVYERSVLNIFQYLCGIASETKKIVKLTQKINSQITVLDTRKILPGFRNLSKYAVKIGGGKNHRQGLYDMYLIKDNHWKLAEQNQISMESIVKKMKSKKIEIECSTKKQVIFLLQKKIPVDVIMLDNMKIKTMKEMVSLIKDYNFQNNKKIKIEVSGNINKKKIASLKGLEIDFISIGKLTHSVMSSDISLNIV